VFVMGGVLKILSSARIDGDVIFYGMEGEISGEVGGSVYGSANSLRIDNKIAGDVDVNVNGNLTLGSKADIAGNVRYRGTNNLIRAQDSIVAGEIQKNAPAAEPDANPLRNILIPLFISLFATLTLYLLFKREMQLTLKTIMDAPLQTGFIGLATILVGPFVSLLLVSTVLGMLLGVFGIGAILMLIAIGFTMAIVFTGALVSRLVLGTATISLLWILIGALVFHAALLMPYIGLTFALAFISLAVGGVLVTLYRRAR